MLSTHLNYQLIFCYIIKCLPIFPQQFCRNLKSLAQEDVEKLSIRRSVATGELEVTCFIEDMDRVLKVGNLLHNLKYLVYDKII